MTTDPLPATVTQRGVVFGPDGDVLVVRRAADGGWELPGGRVDRGEDAVDALRRELHEETTLDPDVVAPVHTLTWRNDDGDGRFGVYYYCRADERDVSLSHEHDDHDWGSPSPVRDRLSDPQQTAVDAALARHRGELEPPRS